MIDYGKFGLSLLRLEQQHVNWCDENPALSNLDREGIAESVIQRYETSYDCLWKVMKRYLTKELGLPDIPNSPKTVLRLANDNGLFASALEQCLQYADARNEKSHDYDGKKARDCLKLMPDFTDVAIGLYLTMSEKSWG